MKKKKIAIIIAIALLIGCGIGGFFFWQSQQLPQEQAEPVIIEPEPEKGDDYLAMFATWQEHKALNDDYVGEIIFDSGIINLPFVQGSNNEYYERRDWISKEHDEEGSIFMDADGSTDNDNIVIYGHYVYPSYEPSLTHKFTPLYLLMDEQNYEANKTLKIVLEDEIREYQVALVYNCPLEAVSYDEGTYYTTRADLEYWHFSFLPEHFSKFHSGEGYSKNYFKNYYKGCKKLAFYDTGIELQAGDNLLTLQTCVENRKDLREIVICKEIGRIKRDEIQ